MVDQKGKLILLSGASGSGKTSLCRQVIQAAVKLGISAGGVLSPGHFDAGIKTGINVMDVRTGETRLLASQANSLESSTGSTLRTPAWQFDQAAADWGDGIIANALPADLLVIDELGPLEWLQNRGWTSAFHVIDSRQYRLCLLVTRPELLHLAQARWPDAGIVQIRSVLEIPALSSTILAILAGSTTA